MTKNGSAVLIVFLFIFPILIPIQLTTAESMNTIYVDDDNIWGPWDGTMQHPFRYIQDGIDSATVGDTVFVFEGTYTENVMINKSIILRGEDKNITVLNPLDTDCEAIAIETNEVNIKNFRLSEGQVGINIVNSSNIFITKNIIEYNVRGITIYSSDSVYIECNVIKDNEAFGIYSYLPSSNIIFNNLIENNSHGIYSLFSHSLSTNYIRENIIKNNEDDGIDISRSSNNIIENCTITHNEIGIQVDGGNNNIINNHISYNELYGIDVGGYCSTFVSNICSYNSIGIFLSGWKQTVRENRITFNKKVGLKSSGHHDKISNNLIRFNYGDGLSLSGAHFEKVFSNSITDNDGYGIFLTYTWPPKGIPSLGLRNKIRCNNIVDNNESAYFILNYLTRWNGNYWGEEVKKPYVIHGDLSRENFPWINYDWHPAQEPYDIGGGGYE